MPSFLFSCASSKSNGLSAFGGYGTTPATTLRSQRGSTEARGGQCNIDLGYQDGQSACIQADQDNAKYGCTVVMPASGVGLSLCTLPTPSMSWELAVTTGLKPSLDVCQGQHSLKATLLKSHCPHGGAGRRQCTKLRSFVAVCLSVHTSVRRNEHACTYTCITTLGGGQGLLSYCSPARGYAAALEMASRGSPLGHIFVPSS